MTAFEILIPVKTWLKDAGWHQGLRLLVIAYALLPLLFLALLSSSSSLSVPGFAYSLYVAPLWAIAWRGRSAAWMSGTGHCWKTPSPPDPWGLRVIHPQVDVPPTAGN